MPVPQTKDNSDFTGIAAIEFEPLMTGAEAATFCREVLPDRVACIRQTMMITALTKPQLVKFLRDVHRDDGMDGLDNILTTAASFEDWATDLVKIAEAVKARVVASLAALCAEYAQEKADA